MGWLYDVCGAHAHTVSNSETLRDIQDIMPDIALQMRVSFRCTPMQGREPTGFNSEMRGFTSGAITQNRTRKQGEEIRMKQCGVPGECNRDAGRCGLTHKGTNSLKVRAFFGFQVSRLHHLSRKGTKRRETGRPLDISPTRASSL